jgi:hypothetical protein
MQRPLHDASWNGRASRPTSSKLSSRKPSNLTRHRRTEEAPLQSSEASSTMESCIARPVRSSDAVDVELMNKLQLAFRSSTHLGVPNAFRTAMCCDVLDKICVSYNRYSKVTANTFERPFFNVSQWPFDACLLLLPSS